MCAKCVLNEHVYWCICLYLCGAKCVDMSIYLCVCLITVCVCVCPSSCCLCNPSKHQGSALLCWINKSLTSIATCRLWNTHRLARLSTLNSQSFSRRPTLLFPVSNYTPVKYRLISRGFVPVSLSSHHSQFIQNLGVITQIKKPLKDHYVWFSAL